MSPTDSRPPSQPGAHTLYGSSSGGRGDRRRRWIFIALGVIVLALILWGVYAVTTPSTTQGPGGRGGGAGGRRGGGGIPTAVNAAKAEVGDIPIYLNELGTATPLATVTVVSQIAGQLQSIGFQEGQMVKKGQFLAQIDPRPYQQMLLQAQATLAKDQATLVNARLDLKRYQTLVAQDSVSRQTLDTQVATVNQDEAQVKADEASVAQQKLNLAYCRITSPVDGRVGIRQVDVGNYVTVGSSTGIVVVTEVDPMDVLFTLPEDNLGQVSARMRSGATLEAVALDRAQEKTLATGRLFTLDNQVDTTTGTVRAKARFDNRTGALFPNQFVNVRLTVDTLHNVVIVPTSAILKGPNGMFVYVAAKEGPMATVSVVNVKTGPAAGDNTAILSGLQSGDVVVTDGSDRLKDGATVILPGDCIPAGAHFGGRGGKGGAAGAGGKPGGGGFFGLFKKPAQDPMAALRCKPGQKPSSLLSGAAANPFALSFGAPAAGAATTAPAPAASTTVSKTVSKSTTTTSSIAPAQAPAAPPAPLHATAAAPPPGGGEGHGGGGRGGRMQQMIAALNLDPAQQQQAQAIFAAAGQQAQSTGDFRAAMQGAFAKLEAILRPDQKAKFEQMRAEAAARRARESAGGSPDQ